MWPRNWSLSSAADLVQVTLPTLCLLGASSTGVVHSGDNYTRVTRVSLVRHRRRSPLSPARAKMRIALLPRNQLRAVSPDPVGSAQGRERVAGKEGQHAVDELVGLLGVNPMARGHGDQSRIGKGIGQHPEAVLVDVTGRTARHD